MTQFSDRTLTAAVVNSLESAEDPRLREVVSGLVRHLHGFIREVAPTEAEWNAGMRFLAEAGWMCDDRRQEFNLLSDILGATMMVDYVNHRAPDGASEFERARSVLSGRRRGHGGRVEYLEGWPRRTADRVRAGQRSRPRADRGSGSRRLADLAFGPLREPGSRTAGDEPARQVPDRRGRGATAFARSGHRATRSPTTARRAGCCARLAGTPIDRRTFTSSSRPKATRL